MSFDGDFDRKKSLTPLKASLPLSTIAFFQSCALLLIPSQSPLAMFLPSSQNLWGRFLRYVIAASNLPLIQPQTENGVLLIPFQSPLIRLRPQLKNLLGAFFNQSMAAWTLLLIQFQTENVTLLRPFQRPLMILLPKL